MINRGVGVAALTMMLLGAVGWWTVRHDDAAVAADAPPDPAVPVQTAQAQIRDVPVLLSGLGTVQALNTVQIKAQVSGTLIALPVKEGEEVHQGDVIAQIDPRPFQAALDQAVAQRKEDAALLRSAQLDLERYQNLAKRNFAPVQQVDDQEATVEKQAAAVAFDTAQIDTAQINLGYCTVRAPIDGRVSLYQVDVGNVIQTSGQTTGIVSITQTKPIAVVFTLPEADLDRVQAARANGPVAVQVASGADPTRIVATGTLLTPNNTIDTATGTISLKASFPNEQETLWPGEFVNTKVQVSVMPHAVTVPLPAVQHGPDGLFVYTVKPDQTVQEVTVKVAYQDDTTAVIGSGLTGEETIVLSGQSRLAPGDKIKASPRSA